MMKRERTVQMFRLRYKMFCVLLLGIAAAVGFYFAVEYLGESLINRWYMNEEAIEERQEKYEESLSRYVQENQVSIRDVSRISEWVQSKKNVYLILYDGDYVVYESGWWDENSDIYSAYVQQESNEYAADEAAADDTETEPKTENSASGGAADSEDMTGTAAGETGETQEAADIVQADGSGDVESSYVIPMHDIAFTDGVFSASIIEFSEMKWYDVVGIFSWSALIGTILAALLLYSRYITNRVVRLSHEVADITGGKWDAEIHCNGRDELSKLADDVDNLRDTMLQRLESEKEAWNTNSELITSMSHDIRTPLTTLIGYLDILDSGDYRSQEELERYIGNCKQKALQLKDLSDKMFQYFLVFGRDSLEMENETYDTEILLQQLLGEHLFYLSNMGFRLSVDFTKKKSRLTADIHYLKRLFDNLFSNIKKYAAPEGEVRIQTKIVGEGILICLSNDIRKDDALVESTNIGLKTCQKIVEQMGGRFHAEREENRFEVRVLLPVELNGKEDGLKEED